MDVFVISYSRTFVKGTTFLIPNFGSDCEIDFKDTPYCRNLSKFSSKKQFSIRVYLRVPEFVYVRFFIQVIPELDSLINTHFFAGILIVPVASEILSPHTCAIAIGYDLCLIIIVCKQSWYFFPFIVGRSLVIGTFIVVLKRFCHWHPKDACGKEFDLEAQIELCICKGTEIFQQKDQINQATEAKNYKMSQEQLIAPGNRRNIQRNVSSSANGITIIIETSEECQIQRKNQFRLEKISYNCMDQVADAQAAGTSEYHTRIKQGWQLSTKNNLSNSAPDPPKKKIIGMSEEHKEILRVHSSNIMNSISTCVEEVIDNLYTHGVITDGQKVKLYSIPNRHQQVKSLLDILPERGSKAFELFCKSLTKCHPELKRKLVEEAELIGLPVSIDSIT
ncbi:uncharacterized protein TRIADDRAFT_52876 [Trichoplax adhaerens]|uniref:CARD domain-containing protein n=1 Tax=Trichoplax adhaerens TaxID=10228 RepID=B3RMP5_TRIAD|nr:hypothetical protein TRIADDRAFT_52876 [Trichoplax adhaerens]EDV27310.1 hypothetical protein TRIADDRAFT_52876 [Trichoplax adhaerens]|eukprot:XP_002109144.1 hypothetical protein TRIADDRAFT_52876 [Trichoplax adhaerens]